MNNQKRILVTGATDKVGQVFIHDFEPCQFVEFFMDNNCPCGIIS